MNAQEKQLIDLLFSKLQQTVAQSGPRDAQAEAQINQLMEKIPGAGYYMAQAIIVQQQALKQAETKITQLEQQTGSSQGFLPAQPTASAQKRQTSQPALQPQQSQGGGFLAGAAQTALGIGGGILLANAGMALFDDLAYGDEVDLYNEGYADTATEMVDDSDLVDNLDDFGFDDL